MRWLSGFVIAVGCASHGSTPDASPTSVELVCESQGATFPKLEKACSVASDCFIAEHEINCCGTQIAVGFNVASKTVFTSAEMTCAAAYPACGCASEPTKAEDGRSVIQGTIGVRCASSRCQTFVP